MLVPWSFQLQTLQPLPISSDARQLLELLQPLYRRVRLPWKIVSSHYLQQKSCQAKTIVLFRIKYTGNQQLTWACPFISFKVKIVSVIHCRLYCFTISCIQNTQMLPLIFPGWNGMMGMESMEYCRINGRKESENKLPNVSMWSKITTVGC